MTQVMQLVKMMAAKEAEHQASKPKPQFGAFAWTAENRYPAVNAVRIFKRECDAEKFARKCELVVRTIA